MTRTIYAGAAARCRLEASPRGVTLIQERAAWPQGGWRETSRRLLRTVRDVVAACPPPKLRLPLIAAWLDVVRMRQGA